MRLLRRRWPLIAFGIAVGLAVAVAYQKNVAAVFSSNMKILIAQRSSELTTSGTSRDGSIDSATLRDDLLATHIELMRSPRILNDAIELGQLDKLDSFIEARREGTSALSCLSGGIEVWLDWEGDTWGASVLQVTHSGPNPADSPVVLQAVYDSYRQYVRSQTRNVGEEAASLIRDAQVTNESELRDATKAYQEFVASSDILLDGDELRSVPHERLKGIEQELTEIRSQLSYAKSRFEIVGDASTKDNSDELSDIEQLALLSAQEIDRLKLFMEVTSGEVNTQRFQMDQPLRSAALNTEYDKVLGLILREQALTADFGDDHPLVERVRDEIASVKKFIREKSPDEFEDFEIKKMSASQILGAYTIIACERYQ